MTSTEVPPTPAVTTKRRRLFPRVEEADPLAIAPLWLRALMIFAGIAIGGIFLGLNTGLGASIWSESFEGTLGSSLGTSHVIALATPLILASCAVAIGLRVGLWNIGVEGQLIMGAWMATAVAYAFPDLPGVVLIVFMLLASLVGGGLWALVPALSRAYLGVSEAITTLLLNFVATLWMTYWATGPWSDPGTISIGSISSKEIVKSAWLPQYSIGSLEIGMGFFIAVAVAVILWAVFRYTPLWLDSQLVGADEDTATYTGINVARVRAGVFVLSGAIGGLTGAVMEIDQVHKLSTQLSNSTGYVGIVVAVLAAGSLLGVIPIAALLALIAAGGISLQISGVSSESVLILTGILMLLAACGDAISRYRLRRRPQPLVGDDQ
jgi:ABC-type uncharacterized transport system permease subunit